MNYRHIFFTGKSILSGYGQMTIYYTGRIYTNAVRMVNFKSLYDPSKDLVITCSDCARKKYKSFIKIKEK